MRYGTWLPAATIATTIAALDQPSASSREFHVAPNGGESAAGTLQHPVAMTGRAAAITQPGDTVTTHAATYREWIKPPRGGTSEEERIV
jgi:hypothetical protein